jgi:hypothetical protein
MPHVVTGNHLCGQNTLSLMQIHTKASQQYLSTFALGCFRLSCVAVVLAKNHRPQAATKAPLAARSSQLNQALELLRSA